MQQRQWLCNNDKKEGLVRNKGKGLDRSNEWSNPNIKFWFPHGNCVCVQIYSATGASAAGAASATSALGASSPSATTCTGTLTSTSLWKWIVASYSPTLLMSCMVMILRSTSKPFFWSSSATVFLLTEP